MTSQIDELSAQIEENPTNAWLFCKRGWHYWNARQLALAREDFNRAINLDPDEPAFWKIRGQLLERLGHVTLSRNDLDRAVELAPNDPDSYNVRGWCYKLFHFHDAALADLDRAIALDPLVPEYHYRRAIVGLSQRDREKALVSLDEAIRLRPEESLYFYKRAMALLYANPRLKPEVALPDLETAIRLGPEKLWYRMDRGYIRFYQGRWSEAAEDFTLQDFQRQYANAPFLGAERVIWIDLARRFEGQHNLGLESIREYLDWYLNESHYPTPAFYDPDDLTQKDPEVRLKHWPVPLALFLAGEIDERQLLGCEHLNPTDPDPCPVWLEEIAQHRRECHFVMAQLALAEGQTTKAKRHLFLARGLPTVEPMAWVVGSQLRQLRNMG